MRRAFPRWAPVVLGIVTGTTGCDNDGWGGAHIRLEPPPPPPGWVEPDPDALAADPTIPMPTGEIAYRVVLTEDGARATGLLSFDEDGLHPLPDESVHPGFTDRFVQTHLPAARELILFSDGDRVGTFISEGEASVDRTTCIARPEVAGFVEILPGAAERREFLALSPALGGERTRTHSPEAPSMTPERRVALLNLAGVLLNELGAEWPPSVEGTRRDLHFLAPEREDAPPPFATSFVFRDDLSVGPVSTAGWSLFYIAEHDGNRYRPTHTRFMNLRPGEKAIPRWIDRLSFEDGGNPRALLEIFGEEDRWFSVLEKSGGEWREIFTDGCAPAPA